MRRFAHVLLVLVLMVGVCAQDLPQTVYPSAQNARAKLVTILTQTTRGTTEQTNATALVSKWSLASINVATFGRFANAKGDNSVAITSGTKSLTSTAGLWLASDVGRTIDIAGAGAAGATLRTTIAAYVSAGSITLSDAASTTVTPSTTSAVGLAIWGDVAGMRFDTEPLKDEAGKYTYQPVSLTTTGGTVAQSVGDKLAESISVKDFGATGNFVTDDGPAFTAALAYASTAGERRVFVPVGHYKITTAIIIPASNLILCGDGKGTIIENVGGGADPKGIVIDSKNRVTIEKMTVIPYTSGSFRNGIDMVNAAYCRAIDIWSTPADGNAIWMMDCNWCEVARLWFDGGATRTGYAVILTGCVGCRVSDSHAFRPRFGFVMAGGDIPGERTNRTSAETYGNIFTNCTVYSAEGHSFDINATQGNVISACTASDWGGTGDPTPAFQNKHPNGDGTKGNVFIGCTARNVPSGFYTQQGSNSSFIGCNATNITYNAFWINDANRMVISGCTATDFGEAGIHFEGSSRGCVTTNVTLETATATAWGIKIEGAGNYNVFDNVTTTSTLAYFLNVGAGCAENRFGAGCKTFDQPILDTGGSSVFPVIFRTDRQSLASVSNTAGDFIPRGIQVVRASFVVTTATTGSPQIQCGRIGGNASVAAAQVVTGAAGNVVTLTKTAANVLIDAGSVAEIRCATSGTGEGFAVYEGFHRN